ncbi:hypothetical protein VTO73DRAFT_9102 [Trametes versicolor]
MGAHARAPCGRAPPAFPKKPKYNHAAPRQSARPASRCRPRCVRSGSTTRRNAKPPIAQGLANPSNSAQVPDHEFDRLSSLPSRTECNALADPAGCPSDVFAWPEVVPYTYPRAIGAPASSPRPARPKPRLVSISYIDSAEHAPRCLAPAAPRRRWGSSEASDGGIWPRARLSLRGKRVLWVHPSWPRPASCWRPIALRIAQRASLRERSARVRVAACRRFSCICECHARRLNSVFLDCTVQRHPGLNRHPRLVSALTEQCTWPLVRRDRSLRLDIPASGVKRAEMSGFLALRRMCTATRDTRNASHLDPQRGPGRLDTHCSLVLTVQLRTHSAKPRHDTAIKLYERTCF